MIYMRKHPTYSADRQNTNDSMMTKQTSFVSNNNAKPFQAPGVKKSVIQAREFITGQSFKLENHTIDEEQSDDSERSETNQKPTIKSSSGSSISNFASLPRHTEPLDKIIEEPYEDQRENYTSNPLANNQTNSPLMGKNEEKNESPTRSPVNQKPNPATSLIQSASKPLPRGVPRMVRPNFRPPDPPQPVVQTEPSDKDQYPQNITQSDEKSTISAPEKLNPTLKTENPKSSLNSTVTPAQKT